MIRVGLAGFGLGGRVFHAPLVSSVDGLELAAIVERSSNKAVERYPGIVTYRSFEAILGDSSLGLIVISTPSGTHYELACQALKAGKNLVVDKPMAASSTEIADLMGLAKAHNVLLAPFHNRRWDNDFLTIQKLLHEGSLGRLVHFESNLDRWRTTTRAAWKEDPAQAGGILLDLGTHLVDEVLFLFGKPEAVSAEIGRERDGEGSDDVFALRLRYPAFQVLLGSTCLACLPRPRFLLRGTKGNYRKWAVDPQEAALSKVTRIGPGAWGEEPTADWGVLCVDVDGGMVTRPVPTLPGDYRQYYAGVRDALLGKAPAPLTGLDAWRAARVLEWARMSSDEHREITCDWSGEPA